MSLAPRLDLRQSQSLVMTPQLQQAIKLLALSNLEIEGFLASELENNPLLEAGPEDGPAELVERAESGDVDADAAFDMPAEPLTADHLIASGDAAADQPLDVDYAAETFHHDGPTDGMPGMDGGLGLDGRAGGAGPGPGEDGGFEATLSIIQRDPDTQVAQLVQAQLRPLGINLKIEILERQAWVPKVLGHNHEIAMGRVNVPRADPDQVFGPFFGRSASQNWSNIKDPAVFDAVDAARRATDRNERRALYGKTQQLLLDKDYYAWLFFREARHVVRAELQNLEIDSGGAWLLGSAWLRSRAA